MKDLITLKSQQQGSTLLEILVSVFVLGFGLLALVSMQMKTVMVSREAENQTIVAQATDSLIESMLMNPNLNMDASSTDKIMYRNFEEYRANMDGMDSSCNNDEALSTAATSGLSKKQLAEAHLCTFAKRVSQIPNTGKVYWNICMETPALAAAKPELDASTPPKVKCTGGANATSTVFKVVWEQELEDSERYQNSGLTLNAAGTAVLYSYQAPISR